MRRACSLSHLNQRATTRIVTKIPISAHYLSMINLSNHLILRYAWLYLEQGADPILAGEEWATPLAWAEKKSNTDIADLIMRYL